MESRKPLALGRLVRRLRPSDSGDLRALCEADTRFSRHFREHRLWLDRALADLAQPGRTVFGAFSPTPVGGGGQSYQLDACIFFKPSEFDDSAELKNLVVRPEGPDHKVPSLTDPPTFQSLARLVIEKAVRHCEVRQIRKLEIELPQEEHDSISLFLKLGFRVAALRERYFPGQYVCVLEKTVGEIYLADPFETQKLAKWLLQAILPCRTISEGLLELDEDNHIHQFLFEAQPVHPAFDAEGRKGYEKRLRGSLIVLEEEECTDEMVQQIVESTSFKDGQLRFVLAPELSGLARKLLAENGITSFELKGDLIDIAGGERSSLSIPLQRADIGGVVTVLEMERIIEYSKHSEGFVYYLLADMGRSLLDIEKPLLMVYCPSWRDGSGGIVAAAEIHELAEAPFEGVVDYYPNIPSALTPEDLDYYRTRREDRVVVLHCLRLELLQKPIELDDEFWDDHCVMRDYLTRELTETNLVYIDSKTSELLRSTSKEPFVIRDLVFFSYSPQDRIWFERFNTMLAPSVRNKSLVLWSDSSINPGALRQTETALAIERAKIAVLLVSPKFFNSEVVEGQLPALLAAADSKNLTLVWVPIQHSLYEETEIAKYQAAHTPLQPLESLTEQEQNEAVKAICEHLRKISK